MADDGKWLGSALILPDEISKVISSCSNTYAPISWNAGASELSVDTDAITLASGDTLVLKLNCITNSLHVEANSSNKVRCIVAAIINNAA